MPKAPWGPPTTADPPPMDGRRREWGMEWERDWWTGCEGWRWAWGWAW